MFRHVPKPERRIPGYPEIRIREIAVPSDTRTGTLAFRKRHAQLSLAA